MSRVLVPMSRKTADYAALLVDTGDGDVTASEAYLAIRAALDTDREELVEAIVRELYRQGVQFEGSIEERVAHAAGTARAVLALLENGGDA